YIGGSNQEVQAGVAFKVKIRHSSAMLEALLTDSIVWKEDPDFGYMVVDVEHPSNASLLEQVPVEILAPARYYERTERTAEYRAWVSRMTTQRRSFLESFAVDGTIIDAVCGVSVPRPVSTSTTTSPRA
ncbi:MAG: hypothetical protein QGG40_15655, partial [Myxococcota bacterium]|nr:hypothetical protein [Myxococcota bacterium]